MLLSDSCTYLRGRERDRLGVSALGFVYNPGRNKHSCFPSRLFPSGKTSLLFKVAICPPPLPAKYGHMTKFWLMKQKGE